MKMVKSLILGSAAGLVAIAGAQAADLPVKAKAVEYVKVCSLYGAGFWYVPGTDTCMKIGGYLRADVTFNGSGAYDTPAWGGASSRMTRDRDYYIFRSRQDINLDTRTATEYGVVRTYFDATFSWTTGDGTAGGSLGVYYAFVQFAGFTFGKAVSQFDAPWSGYPGNNTSYLLGGSDDVTGTNQVAYTAQFGNGVSASVSVEDAKNYTRGQLVTVLDAAGAASGVYAGQAYGGTAAPDIVGQLRVDQAWGLFQLSAVAHNIHASYYGATELTGHPSDKWGYAVQGALSIKNLPTGPGDTINITGTYSDGAVRYVLGTLNATGYAMYNNVAPVGGAYQSVAIGFASDGIFGLGGQIQTTRAFGVRGAYTHNFDPYWSASLFGSYSYVDYNAAATNLYCPAYATVTGAKSADYSCNPDFALAQVGGVVRWTPVKNLTFSGEVMYTYIDQKFTGSAVLAPGGFKPTLSYSFRDQGTVTGSLRVQRTF